MRLAAYHFSGNGLLRGSLVALDDGGEALGWEHAGNWSSASTRDRAVKDLAATVGITTDRARAAVAAALRDARRQVGFPDDAAPQHEHPVIDITARQPREIAAESWAVLQCANEGAPRFYRFGGGVARLENGGGPYLQVLSLAGLRRHLNTRADYIVESDRGQRAAVVPRNTLEEMLSEPEPPLPPVEGISRTPVLAPGGEIVMSSGYAPELQTYLDVPEVPPLPEVVGPAHVARALNLLTLDVLGDFPLAGQSDRANALALLLAPIVRCLSPLHDIEAPSPGTGKGLLAHVAGIIATGAEPAGMTEARSEDEWRKRITSTLRRAPSMVLLDNVRQRLDSAHLSSVLTARAWTDRKLGESEDLTLPNRAVWTMTANNPSFSGEIARRVVRIRLDAAREHPWERTGFRHDPLRPWVRAHRGEILHALLVLVRAWIQEGMPPGEAIMGSYEEYAATIGGILQVAGVHGFLANRGEVYESAESDEAVWVAFLGAWWETYGGDRVAMDQLFDLARERRLLTDLRAGRSDQGARTVLGVELAARRDRVTSGYVVRRSGTRGHGAVYRLEVTNT